MRFVYDEYLEFGFGGRNPRGSDHVLAHVINPGMAGRVNLYYVKTAAFPDVPAVVAFIARFVLPFLPVQAIQGFGEQSGHGCLADAARPAEEISVRYFTAGDFVLQGQLDMVLADQLGKKLRPVLAI